MNKNRLEAFSDGVVAIIITIMVLELKVPHGSDPSVLLPLVPVFLCYLMSFVFLGIYWNNHHHLLQAAKHVNGKILWANQHLLLWLSMIPFVTAWMGENNFDTWPVVFYGIVLIGASIAYYILAHSLITHHGKESPIASALGTDFKGKISIVIYAVGIACSFIHTYIACALYIFVTVMWMIPDKRIERTIA